MPAVRLVTLGRATSDTKRISGDFVMADLKPAAAVRQLSRGRAQEGHGSRGLGAAAKALICLPPRLCRGRSNALHALSAGWRAGRAAIHTGVSGSRAGHPLALDLRQAIRG
jgi:hypothetical protein